MAHNLETFEDGTTAFFTAREVAWHKLGTVTDNALTAEDALTQAHLNWEVRKSEQPVSTIVPVFNSDTETTKIEYSDKFMTYRYHPKNKKAEALGVVGSRYTPVQNSEAFAFLNDLSDESGAVFETAGSIDNGKKVFMSMKMPNDMLIGGVDKIDTYLLAWNTHDGSSSFTVAVTPIRVVCQNTLTMAIKKAENSFSLRHTPRVSGKVQAARDTLNLTYRYVEEFEKEAEMLIAQSMTDKEFKLIVEKMIPIDEESERARNLADTARDTMLALWKAPTQLNVAGTKWAAYNAIVEYSDWAKPIRSENPDVKRAEKIVKGQGERFKNRALALLS
jgi:phage/plasmid-like protein (TIGR03299 family)